MLPISKTGIDPCVARYIDEQGTLEGKVIVDFPAGNGRFSQRLAAKGAKVLSMDLFPQFFKAEGLECQFADMTERLPLEDESVDWILCQEGIEHVSDQLGLLKEFNRVLRPDGRLLITTPSCSHMRARVSNLLVESEYWKRMPPSEIESVWFSEEQSDKLYYGHLFLIPAQKLRSLSAIAGFRIEERRYTDTSVSSLLLAIPFYPVLYLVNLLSRFFSSSKNKHVDGETKAQILAEQQAINCSASTLLCKHLFWIFTKERNEQEVVEHLKALTRK